MQYKQQSRLEEKRKKALDLQLDFIVGQTERYSDLLSQSLQATPAAPTSVPSRRSQPNAPEEDGKKMHLHQKCSVSISYGLDDLQVTF